MRSELDRRIDDGVAALTGSGGPLAVGAVEREGQTLPLITTVPPSLPGYFAHYCAENAGKTFLVADDERLTFAEVLAEAEKVARALVAGFGIAKGDRVGIAMRNSPSWIALYMGVLMAGGIAVLLNGWWQAGELADALGDVDCRLVFADPPRAFRLAELPDAAAPVVTIEDALPLADALAPVTGKDDPAVALPVVAGDDDATILFTSGSTGQCKGALSDHRAVVQATYSFLTQALTILGIATEDGMAPTLQPTALLNIPLFHVTAEVAVLLQSFAMGRKLVLMPKWDAEEAMRLIQAEQVTYFVGVPLMSYEMLTHPRRASYDLSTVTDFAAGGAPRPPEHVARLNAGMGGGAPLIGYGLTETNAVGCLNVRGNYLARPDSAGRTSRPLVEIAILDGAGHAVATGVRGEVAIRSIANFKRYWGCDEATRAAITPDGYFLSGDIGYLDDDGYLFIVDRKKDIIIRGGENISCQEVEAALYRHPAVAEAAVFGLADDRFGEVPGAVIHLHDGAALTAEDLAAFLVAHLAAFKVPQHVWFEPAPLPRLGTEKIDKVGVRAKYRALHAAA